MLPASIQITGELLSAAEVQDICESLKEDSVRLLSVRGCQLSDRDFGHVCRGVAESRSLAQLNLNLGVVSSISRTRHLADALKANRSLQTLFLHGSPLLDAGLVTLNPALSTHPTLVCLDLGDCMLGDEALGLICGMLPPDGAKSGLRELTLSANPGISSKGWARLAIAVAHSSQLRVLNLDYNPLGACFVHRPSSASSSPLKVPASSAGDQIAGMLAVAVASSRTLEVLDLEGTGLTNQSAQVGLSFRCTACPAGGATSPAGDLPMFPAGFPGHGGELPDQSARSGSGRERHQPRAAAADLRPAVGGRGGRQGRPAPQVRAGVQPGAAAGAV
ncbi:unnamed protein product [Tetraodon nigroviridis]|uniref:(spotted green pufferfish) hypothetical protein n=1 Tax=Tetraodon nigroviridis TaxID=99883 RepID=Q4S2L7_TETNG|nr:unnamed protein product [Tetraodon nigroviridis]